MAVACVSSRGDSLGVGGWGVGPRNTRAQLCCLWLMSSKDGFNFDVMAVNQHELAIVCIIMSVFLSSFYSFKHRLYFTHSGLHSSVVKSSGCARQAFCWVVSEARSASCPRSSDDVGMYVTRQGAVWSVWGCSAVKPGQHRHVSFLKRRLKPQTRQSLKGKLTVSRLETQWLLAVYKTFYWLNT